MPPAKRRAAIIEATLPLIEDHGTTVTTRQVAEAAGVAEGTIYRVFDSLQDLIDASVRSAFSSERLQEFLRGVDLGGTLEEKTSATLLLLERRLGTVRSLMMVIHHAQRVEPHPTGACLQDELNQRRQELDSWLTAHFVEHSSELRVSPERYVAFLRLLATGRLLHVNAGIDQDLTASLALNGAMRKDQL